MSVDLPRLTVLVPVYNEAETLDDIIAQLHEVPIPMEIVAVNDCSTDLADLGRFGAGWLMTGCSQANGWCGGADFDHLDDVGDVDLAEFAGYWLADI